MPWLTRNADKLEEEVVVLKSEQQRGYIDIIRAVPTAPSDHDGVFDNASPATSSHSSSRTNAVSDRGSISQQTLSDLCNTWFERYHSWFPILHKLSLLEEVENNAAPLVDSPLSIVLKAIVAVTLPHWCLSNPPNREQRLELSTQFRNEVIMQAIGSLSLQSLQAILIITNIDYGAGKLSEFFNLLALCKRMGIQLGLRDLVISSYDNFSKPSMLPPRMLSLPATLIEQEERVRAYWMTEVLDSMSSLGAGWNLGLSQPVDKAWFPCNETIWAFPEDAKAFSSFGDSEVSSAFSLYLSLVTRQLYQVHLFLQQSFDTTSAVDRVRWQEQCTSVDESLRQWRSSATTMHSLSQANNSSDSTLVMITVTFDAAIVSLYQRLALPPMGLGEVHGPWYHAIQRCLSACDDMSTVVRGSSDADLENISPYMIFCIFVAARFYLVHAKILSVEVPRNLDLLIYGLKTCGQRWYFARRLEKVLCTAVAEKKVPLALSSLPSQFYDLQYSSLDIDEALRVWADRLDQDYRTISFDPIRGSPRSIEGPQDARSC
ncbi:Uncharacterized protein BP5553_04870 [Venustampulla echinocandica]|uniref:Xylanolytic transcriptional activator regulatory domain-containing protein n=1 Tax=Venustampulla echinocandica TaxID=2656787 RepID=A0A370TPI2_9HELO|nr:Uncharacterized protein BP5553_04870 [Venustampulla echinocandica]RDL37437.1 Uncharacterized protein BP5553_04870 [Venustampulla echinocandica]